MLYVIGLRTNRQTLNVIVNVSILPGELHGPKKVVPDIRAEDWILPLTYLGAQPKQDLIHTLRCQLPLRIPPGAAQPHGGALGLKILLIRVLMIGLKRL